MIICLGLLRRVKPVLSGIFSFRYNIQVGVKDILVVIFVISSTCVNWIVFAPGPHDIIYGHIRVIIAYMRAATNHLPPTPVSVSTENGVVCSKLNSLTKHKEIIVMLSRLRYQINMLQYIE